MAILAWVLSIMGAFYLGYMLSSIRQKLDDMKMVFQEQAEKKKPIEVEPPSSLIDVLDPIQTARYEHEKMMREMNPTDEQ